MLANYKNLINFFGSQVKTAKMLQVKQPSVNAWLTGKSKMSATVALRAEKLTNGKFRAVDLCPRLAEIENLPQQKTPSDN